MPSFATLARLLLCVCLIAGGWLQAAASVRMASHDHAATGVQQALAVTGGGSAQGTVSDCHDAPASDVHPASHGGDHAGNGALADLEFADEGACQAATDPSSDCCGSGGCQCDCSGPQFPVNLPALAHAAPVASTGIPSSPPLERIARSPSRLIRPPIG